jgi:glucose 1-dehydrogenase
MKAVALFPSQRVLRMVEVPEPHIKAPMEVKLRMLEVGICGTDRELCSFVYGTPPKGSEYLVLGHEGLAQVKEVGTAVTALRPGDLVVPMVRLPCDDLTCDACRAGHQDFCRSGRYREHGIRELHGFMAEYVVEDARYLHPVPVELRGAGILVEPLAIAEKAFAGLRNIQERLPWKRTPVRALVLGAGPVGLLGAMKFSSAGYDVWIYSKNSPASPNAAVARAIGARYISSEDLSLPDLAQSMERIDVVYEAVGAVQLALKVLGYLGPNGIYLVTGIPRGLELLPLDSVQLLHDLVLRNQAILGVVNAGPQAFLDAIEDLTVFTRLWPDAVATLITHRYAFTEFETAVRESPEAIKRVLMIANDETV